MVPPRPGEPPVGIQQFLNAPEFIRVLIGGRGCLSYETPIYDPISCESVAIGERATRHESFHVLAATREGVRVAQASAPFLKGFSTIYDVVLRSGKKIKCTDQHRMLTPYGWRELAALCAGDLLATSPNLSDGFHPALSADARPLMPSTGDSRFGCHSSRRFCDEFLPQDAGSGLCAFPLQDGAQVRSFGSLATGGTDQKLERIHLRAGFSRLATSHSASRFSLGSFFDTSCQASGLVSGAGFYNGATFLKPEFWIPQTGPQFQPQSEFDTWPEVLQTLEACGDRIHWEPISSIIKGNREPYYDLTVPAAGNYWADGLWHHNSAKTTGLAEDITRHIFQNAGAKAIIARQTEVSQADSSIDTFWQFFEKLGPLYSDSGPGLFKSWNNGRTFRVPSKLAIERFQEQQGKLTTRADIALWLKTEGDKLCGYIEFRGLPDADKGKFRGMECSFLALVEADQIAQKQFALSLACLRWKGTDPETCDEMGFIKDRCVVLDTNPPGPSHWIAQMEKEQEALPKEERVARFWHLCTDDNAHNLPEGYIEQTIMLPYRNNPAMIQRMRYGQYADAFEGKPVYYNYDQTVHEGRDLPWVKGAYLVRQWDFGTHNAVVWSAYWTEKLLCRFVRDTDGKSEQVEEVIDVEFWHDLLEQYLESSDTDAQATAAVAKTKEEFPFWNDRDVCAGILDYCDPAGANSTYTRKIEVNGKKVTESAINILRTHNVYPGYTTTARGLQETIAICNRLFAKRVCRWNPANKVFESVPVYRVDARGCPLLVRGAQGGYRYPILGEPGYGQDAPLKGEACEHLDHLQDAARYGRINALRLLKTEHEEAKRPNYLAARVKNPNPPKKLR